MTRYRVPVYVEVKVPDDEAAPDSADVARLAHEVITKWETLAEQEDANLGAGWVMTAVEGIPAYEDDPDSPPVPAEPIE